MDKSQLKSIFDTLVILLKSYITKGYLKINERPLYGRLPIYELNIPNQTSLYRIQIWINNRNVAFEIKLHLFLKGDGFLNISAGKVKIGYDDGTDDFVFPFNEKVVQNNLEEAFKYWLSLIDTIPKNKIDKKFADYMNYLERREMWAHSIRMQGNNPRSFLSRLPHEMLGKIDKSIQHSFM